MPPEALARRSLEHAVIVTATAMEASAVRRRVRDVPVVRSGMGMRRGVSVDGAAVVLSVGLAGGLQARHATGTVVVPSRVADAEGRVRVLDEELCAVLAAASHRLGFPTVTGDIITTSTVVTGAERARLAAGGFVAADMETAAVAALAPRCAAVRVVLDTPLHELSPAWQHPLRVAWRPDVMRELPWLLREGRRCADRAARVVAAAA